MRKFSGLAVGTVFLVTWIMPGTSLAAGPNAAVIEVSVPADAQVWFDDSPTGQNGPERSFESPALTPGKTYSYTVTAQWRAADGTEVIQKRRVSVRANETSNVEFVPRARTAYYYEAPADYNWGYGQGYYGQGRGLFRNYYRVGNVIINGRRWGDIGYRYSHADLIRW